MKRALILTALLALPFVRGTGEYPIAGRRNQE
jgi:hypothetical protein